MIQCKKKQPTTTTNLPDSLNKLLCTIKICGDNMVLCYVLQFMQLASHIWDTKAPVG